MTGSEGTIREERPEDHAAIRNLLADAFGQADEATIVERLRAEHRDAFGPALVAELEGEIVGYVCCSTVRVDEAPAIRMLGLGPIAVLPGRQAMGIGTALMHRIQEVVHEPIVLLGDPAWYSRFGFQAAAPLGLRSQWADVGPAWMVWFPPDVDADAYRGTARYLPPFERV